MKTVRETDIFKKQANKIWSEDERLEFITFIAANPEAGDVILARMVRERFAGLLSGQTQWCQGDLFQPGL